MSQGKANFTLVHGTFGANSKWLNQSADEDAQGFRAQLALALDCAVHYTVPAPWGGVGIIDKLQDLTNRARIDGATKLSKELRELPQGDANFVVAHSHGGNVAMLALQDKPAQSRVNGLICLATPFLYPRRRPLSITALVLSVSIMVIGYLQLANEFELWSQSTFTWLFSSGLALISVVIPSIMIFFIARVRWRRLFIGDDSLEKHIQRISYQNPNIPILLIRASGDEASGILRATQFLNWLAGMVMRFAGKQLYLLLCFAVLFFAYSVYQGLGWIPQSTVIKLSYLMMVLSMIMVIMLIALTVSRVSVGLDAWRWVGEIETMVEDGPPGITTELSVLTPRQPKRGLSHTSIFTEPETIVTISEWCKRVASHSKQAN